MSRRRANGTLEPGPTLIGESDQGWVDDVTLFQTANQVLDSIDRVIAASEATRLDLPHVVCVFDKDTGLPTAFGPFESPVAASVFADQYLLDIGCDQCPEVRAVVIPLDSVQQESSRQEHFRTARH